MYLEPWMIITLIVAFGICAIWNKRMGYRQGGVDVLITLIDKKLIRVNETGEIVKG